MLLLNPDSTLEDFRANVAFLRGHCGNPMNFCRTEIYAGTPLELNWTSDRYKGRRVRARGLQGGAGRVPSLANPCRQGYSGRTAASEYLAYI